MSEFQKCFGEKGFWVYEVLSGKESKSVRLRVLLFFVLPSILLFITPLIERRSAIMEYPIWRVVSLLLAAVCVYLCPLLIWKFYDNQVTLFKGTEQDSATKEIFKKNAQLNKRLVVILSVIWIPLVIAVLLVKPEMLERYAIYGYTDCWYYVFVIYVAVILHLTACGFAGLISSAFLKAKTGAYNSVPLTSFLVGLLYLPVLVDFISGASPVYSTGVIIAIFLYLLCIPLYLCVPVQCKDLQ